MTAAPAAVALEDVTVRFGGVTALAGVSLLFPAAPGISAVIGPNGAGKTTLFNVLTGIVRPLSGRIRVAGQDVTGRRPDQVFRAHVARTFQGVRLFEQLDVRQNVNLAARSAGGGLSQAEAALRQAELPEALWRVYPDRLTLLQRRQVEIARALTAEPIALLLDEPAAGLNTAEKEWLCRLLPLLAQDRSCRIVVVEHDMKLVMAIAERVAVMNFGRLLAEGPPEQVRADPAVIEAYLGPHSETDGARA